MKNSLFAFVISSFLSAAPISAMVDPAYEVYLARIAAAEALIQIDEIGDAKMHLKEAPPKYRGWEWSYLNTLTDNSSKTAKADKKGAYALAVSPDGKIVATGGDEGVIRLWDSATLSEFASLKGHTKQVTTLDFSGDGLMLASGSADGTIKIWDPVKMTLVSTITEGLSQKIYEVKFHPDGKRLAAATWDFTRNPFKINGFALIYDLASAKILIRVVGTDHPVSTVDFSPDGGTLAVGDWGALVQTVDTDTGKQVMKMPMYESAVYKAVDNIAFARDSSKIVVVGKDKVVRVIDALTGKTIHEIDSSRGHRKKINSVVFAPGGERYATAASDSLIKIWSGDSNAEERTLRGHIKEVTRIEFSPNGKYAYSVSADGDVKSWDLTAGGPVSFDVCDNGPWSAPVSPDGKFFVAACSDKKIGVWGLDGKPIRAIDGFSANYASFTPTGEFVTVGHDSRAVVWNSEGTETVSFKPHDKSLYGVDVSRTGLIAVAGDNQEAIVFKGKSEIKRLRFEKGTPRYAKFTPDGDRLILGLTTGLIEVFKTSNWESLARMQAPVSVTNLAVSTDGTRLLAGASDGNVTLWNLEEYELVHTLRGHDAAVFGVAFHPSGNRIATGAYDQTVRIWDPVTGQSVLKLRNFETNVYTVEFFDDGRKLFVTETNGTVSVF